MTPPAAGLVGRDGWEEEGGHRGPRLPRARREVELGRRISISERETLVSPFLSLYHRDILLISLIDINSIPIS